MLSLIHNTPTNIQTARLMHLEKVNESSLKSPNEKKDGDMSFRHRNSNLSI